MIANLSVEPVAHLELKLIFKLESFPVKRQFCAGGELYGITYLLTFSSPNPTPSGSAPNSPGISQSGVGNPRWLP